MKRTIFLNLFIFFLLIYSAAQAEVFLPKVFGSHMVIQRDQKIVIWGWAENKEEIDVKFAVHKARTVANKKGEWKVELPAMKAGGPYSLEVKGRSNLIVMTDVLIGDVWLCSGQSNMEWILKNTNDAPREIAQSENTNIRFFTVEKNMSFSPESDFVGGQWQQANPQNSPDFSAVAYYFGKKINQDVGVPIGLVNSSWGGTDIETWISWDEMSQRDRFKGAKVESFEKEAEDATKNREKYENAFQQEKGMKERWFETTTDFDEWSEMILPTIWESTELGQTDGVVWFAKSFELSEQQAANHANLNIGPIDDWDETYVNGQLQGGQKDWTKNRVYPLNPTQLKSGINWVVVKVTDTGGGGGIYGKAEQLSISTIDGSIDLSGKWKYKPAVLSSDFGVVNSGPNEYPSQLYNAMIAPMKAMRIKGVIWYQGENNTGYPYRYRELFPILINDWRNQFDSEFPFLWVQLANFMAADDQPTDSQWAELREAQSRTLTLPKTGQAVIIDIGEAMDIHPRNKKDVGERLALSAEKLVYQMDVVGSGPVYESMIVRGNKVELSFSSLGSGLQAKDKYGYLKGFAIAGQNKEFVWAKAKIEGDKVIVWNENIMQPMAVRYAWGNNPDDANLYNEEGLPASPFRTDQWNVPE